MSTKKKDTVPESEDDANPILPQETPTDEAKANGRSIIRNYNYIRSIIFFSKSRIKSTETNRLFCTLRNVIPLLLSPLSKVRSQN